MSEGEYEIVSASHENNGNICYKVRGPEGDINEILVRISEQQLIYEAMSAPEKSGKRTVFAALDYGKQGWHPQKDDSDE